MSGSELGNGGDDVGEAEDDDNESDMDKCFVSWLEWQRRSSTAEQDE